MAINWSSKSLPSRVRLSWDLAKCGIGLYIASLEGQESVRPVYIVYTLPGRVYRLGGKLNQIYKRLIRIGNRDVRPS